MKILHIIPDDKFWDIPIEIFSSLNVENEYYCIFWGDAPSFNYINSNLVHPIAFNKLNEIVFRTDIDVYMFHSLPRYVYESISSIPLSKTVIVATWGYDIYCPVNGIPPIIAIDLFKKETRKVLNKNSVRQLASKCYHNIKDLLLFQQYKIEQHLERERLSKEMGLRNRIIQRIDFWSTVLPSEYEVLSKLPGFSAKYFPFQYTRRRAEWTIDMIANDKDFLLIGNSSDPSNNHIDILRIIKRRNIKNKIYVPLAYGNQSYAEIVCNELTKRNYIFEVQRTFIPPEAYKAKIQQCRVGIFGHLRQQAIGNINICILQGKKVFLFKDSIAYQFYKSRGFHIFNIEDDLTQEAINNPLTTDEIKSNVDKLNMFSFDVVKEKISRVLSVDYDK